MTKIFKNFGVGILVLLGSVLNFSPPLEVDAGDFSCSDLVFIFARGSGEKLNGPSYQAWQSENIEALARQNLNLTSTFYELGSEPQSGAQYPAVAVSGDLSAVGNLLGAFVSGGAAFNFGASVAEGATELLNYIHQVSATCPASKFILGGYSQGAMLISRSLGQIDAEKVIYVATFGDPKLYLPEGKGNHPVACSGKNLSNYRAYVSDCHAYEGVLGSYRPYQPADYYDKLGAYCNAQDIMCSSGMSISDHTSYTTRGLYQNAARTIASRVHSTFYPDNETEAAAISTHDLLLIVDITYGMQRNIDNYLAEIKSLVQRTRSLGGRVALYTMYQQRRQLNVIRPFILQACDFTCTAAELDAEVNRLSDRLAIGAATGSLPIYMALKQSMRELDWQVGATKTAVVFASEGPLGTDYDGSTLEDIINLSLNIDPVNIFAVTDSAAVADRFTALTSSTNGKTYLLSASATTLVDDVVGRPTARLALETYAGVVGDEFIFDASATEVENVAQGLRYDWDLDADGQFELKDSTPTVSQTYSAPVSGFIQVKVTDEFGYSSTMSAKLDVVATLEEPTKVHFVRAKRTAEHAFEVDFETNASRLLVVLNETPLGFIDSTTQNTFTLTDVAQTSTLYLVPYSATGIRGESASIDLDLAQELVVSPSTEDAPIPDISHLPLKNQTASVPKAPNAGYFAD